MLFTFILVVQAIVAAALVTVILMQRSEGGGLGMGGSPSGFMSARGAADFLTRATTVLATIFVGLSVVLAFIAATRHAGSSIDTSLVGKTAPLSQGAPVQGAGDDGLGGAASAAGNAGESANGAVPLAR
ncbi:preprotein translocase subunit SecG [Sphingobium sufflavum]|uniref:preprotein translocase subunit SecG n=1 Tax=Sphingobium sufflavum TaxID=1129547 RepID=UPI001F1A7672|nr:preprotein translocase subunit SecG [Sphingobium sufflavum]MCE7797776.1 preprotein translocase subunit SecG [Sphingobium sufflavum]